MEREGRHRSQRTGHLNILKYCASRNCKMTADVMAFAAFGGSLECVEFLHKIGVPWSREVCIYAAVIGKLQYPETSIRTRMPVE